MAFIQSYPAHPRRWLLCLAELPVRHKINNDLRRHLFVTIMRVRFTSSSKRPRSLNACSASATVLYPVPLNLSPQSARHTSFLPVSFWQKRHLLQSEGVLLLLLEEPAMSLSDMILKDGFILSRTKLINRRNILNGEEGSNVVLSTKQ